MEAGSLLQGILADSDADGILDLPEGPNRPYPHLVVDIDDRGVDNDGDGSTDAEEIANMTDLNDAGDSFRGLGIASAPGFDPLTNPLVSLTFSSFPGLDYEVETDNALRTFEPVAGSRLSCLRLSRAVAADIHDEWIEQHRYLDMRPLQDQYRREHTAGQSTIQRQSA